jgi:hypothetical protein
MSETVHLLPAERIERIIKECEGVWALFHVNSWERARMLEWRGRTRFTEKQLAVLRTVEKKVFPDS